MPMKRRSTLQILLKLRQQRGQPKQRRAVKPPRLPSGPQLRYLRLQKAFLRHFEGLVRSRILPMADDALGVRRDQSKYQEGNRAVAVALEVYLEDEHVPGLLDIFKHTDKHSRGEMSRVMGVSFGEVGFDSQRAGWVRDNVNLIKSVSFERLGDMQAIIEGAVQGQDRVEVVRKRLMDEFGLTKARAALIARDQTLKLNAQLNAARAVSVGVEEFEWVTSLDERVRGRPGGKWAHSHSNHWKLHGKTFRYDTPPVVNERTGARALPGEDFQCRCQAFPLTDALLGL
jgi:SPP1 gp7 family putative phage head morphogenesis protein